MKLFSQLPLIFYLKTFSYLSEEDKKNINHLSKDANSFIIEHGNFPQYQLAQLMKWGLKDAKAAKKILLNQYLRDKIYFTSSILQIAAAHPETSELILSHPELVKKYVKDGAAINILTKQKSAAILILNTPDLYNKLNSDNFLSIGLKYPDLILTIVNNKEIVMLLNEGHLGILALQQEDIALHVISNSQCLDKLSLPCLQKICETYPTIAILLFSNWEIFKRCFEWDNYFLMRMREKIDLEQLPEDIKDIIITKCTNYFVDRDADNGSYEMAVEASLQEVLYSKAQADYQEKLENEQKEIKEYGSAMPKSSLDYKFNEEEYIAYEQELIYPSDEEDVASDEEIISASDQEMNDAGQHDSSSDEEENNKRKSPRLR